MDKVYEAQVKLTADTSGLDAASAKAKGAASKIAEVGKTAKGAGGALEGMGAAAAGASAGLVAAGAAVLGVVAGLVKLAHMSLEGNMELAAMRKNVAGVMVGFNNWRSGVDVMTQVQASMRDSKAIMQDLEQTEYDLAIPAEQLSSTFRELGTTVMARYGGSVEQVTKLTKGAAAMSKVLGVDLGSASMSIMRFLETRQLRAGSPLRAILADVKNLKTMAPDKLLALVSERMIRMKPAAEEMSKGFGATMFRFKDFFEDTIRDIGGPAFDFISKKLGDWEKRLQDVTGGGKKLVDLFSGAVLGAVSAVSDAIEGVANFITDLDLGGMFAELTTFAKNMWGAFTEGVLGSTSASKDLLGISDMIFMVFNAGVIVAKHAFKWVNDNFEVIRKWIVRVVNILSYLTPQGQMMKLLKLASSPLQGMNSSDVGAAAGAAGKDTIMGEISSMYAARLKRREDEAARAKDDSGKMIPPTKSLIRPGKPEYNFNNYGPINLKQEFREADPDNVFIQFKEGLEGAAEKVTMSKQFSPFGPGVG